MNESKLRNLDLAVLWAVAAGSLAPLVPYALSSLIA
jgi:hypothetical protein